jgi:hypothetical protein
MKIKTLLFLTLIGPVGLFAQEKQDPVRSYLYKTGEKYHVFQYRANVREAPGRNSDVLAVLSLHDKVEIVENSWVQEEINDVWGYWYKIKYGNITGYTFGGNLAVQTVITDIDGNGINDYFYYRLSYSWDGVDYGNVNNLTDIKIYINNKRVSTEKMNRGWVGQIGHSILPPIQENDINRPLKIGYDFRECTIKNYNKYIIMELLTSAKCWVNTFRYKIYPDGNIRIIAYVYDENDDDPENIFFEYLPDGTCKIIAKDWTGNGWTWQ